MQKKPEFSGFFRIYPGSITPRKQLYGKSGTRGHKNVSTRLDGDERAPKEKAGGESTSAAMRGRRGEEVNSSVIVTLFFVLGGQA